MWMAPQCPLSFDLVEYTLSFFGACDLFNLMRTCKHFALAVATALDFNGATLRNMERMALLNGVDRSRCGEFVNDLDLGLLMLDYIGHAHVHRFKSGNERQACLNSLAAIYVSGGAKRSIVVRACNPIYNEEEITAVSPNGDFVLSFSGTYAYLLRTHDGGYSVVAREAVEFGLEVSTRWETTGLCVVVCNPRTKRCIAVCVSNR